MEMMGPDYEQYPNYVDYLERLYKLKREERKPLVSRETLVTVGGHLLAVGLVAAVETRHVWTSKAMQVGLKMNPQSNN